MGIEQLENFSLAPLIDSFSQDSFGMSGDILTFVQILIVSFGYGWLLKTLYYLYFHSNEPQDGSLARSLALLTPALAATFWMVQSSLTLSLGLLGSLSFVRFRTPVKRSEDVGFIVIALAVAIACAGEFFVVAGTFILFLFVYTLARSLLTRVQSGNYQFGVITFNSAKRDITPVLMQTLHQTKIRPQFVSSRTYDGITSYVFNASKISYQLHDEVMRRLKEIDEQSQINIFYPSDRLGT